MLSEPSLFLRSAILEFMIKRTQSLPIILRKELTSISNEGKLITESIFYFITGLTEASRNE